MRHQQRYFVYVVVIVACFVLYMFMFKTPEVEFKAPKVARVVKIAEILPKVDIRLNTTTPRITTTEQSHLAKCPHVSPLLVGALKPNTTSPTWQEVEQSVQNVQNGGLYTPPNCSALQSVVLVIPYRNREEHLRTLLRHMHPFLQRQQARYAILVVEEIKTSLFNKGITINIGFLEAMKRFNPDCVIIHDVDQLPKDDRNTYRCEDQAVHLAVRLSQYGHKLRYNGFFGAAIALTPAHFRITNGFSTEFYGWGKEDDDMLLRLNRTGVGFTRHDFDLTRFESLEHESDTQFVRNPCNKRLFRSRRDHMPVDFMSEGLNTTRYALAETIVHPLYTHIKAIAETPLAHYSPASAEVPCREGVSSHLLVSLVDCAAACTAEGKSCRAFVYDFEDKEHRHTCRLIRHICKYTHVFEFQRFFLKHS